MFQELVQPKELNINIKKFMDYYHSQYIFKFDNFLTDINELKTKQNKLEFTEINDIVNNYYEIFTKDKSLYTNSEIYDYLDNISYEILYEVIFYKNEKYEIEDIKLYEKNGIFQNIITKESLKINNNSNINNLYLLAINQLNKINDYKYPKYKLKILSKVIDIIKNIHNQLYIDSDSILKYVIYIIVMANPNKFYSNIQFLFEFTDKEILMGKEGYLLTSFNSAIDFILKLNSKNLSLFN